MAILVNTTFSIIRGTSETLVCALVTSTGAALDLTGNTAMNLYIGTGLNTTPTLTKALTVQTGYATTSGVLTCAFAPSDTSSLTPGEYIAEVHITYGSGVEYRTNQPFTFYIYERVKT